jgi:hypothetical protein
MSLLKAIRKVSSEELALLQPLAVFTLARRTDKADDSDAIRRPPKNISLQ